MKKERLLQRQRGVFLPAADDIPFAQRASRRLLQANGSPFRFPSGEIPSVQERF
jgi:hypothetical protein